MDREHVERVVDLEARAQERGAVAQAADDEADDERATDADEAGRRGDRHETGDGAAGGADHADLALVEVAREDPRDRRGGGRGVRDHEGVGRDAVGGDRRAGVEPEPAEPQQARAEHGHRHVVRLHRLAVDHATPDEQRDDQGRDARADVDDGAAGEVEGAELVQPAVGRPHPVGERRVHEDRPQEREQDERAEPLALGEGAGDEGRGDRREHQLEGSEQHERDGRRIRGRRLETHAVEHREVEPADEPEAADVRPEGEREPDDHPHDADEGQPEEAVHDRRQHVLAPDQAAVEQRQPRQHDHHECRRHEQPRGIASVHPFLPAASGHPIRTGVEKTLRGDREPRSSPRRDRECRGSGSSGSRARRNVVVRYRPESGAGRGERAELAGGREHRPSAANDLEQDPRQRDRQEPCIQPEQEDAGRDRRFPLLPRDRRQPGDVQDLGQAGPARGDRDDRDDADQGVDRDDVARAEDVFGHTGQSERDHEGEAPWALGDDRHRQGCKATPVDDRAEVLLEAVDGSQDVRALAPAEARQEPGDEPAELKGPEIAEWNATGGTADMDELATAEGWDAVVAPELLPVMKPEGKWVAAPMNIHRINWIWGNKAAMEAVGVTELPKTWADFNAACDKAIAAGKICLAHLSRRLVRRHRRSKTSSTARTSSSTSKAFVEGDVDALRSEGMIKAFDQMRLMVSTSTWTRRSPAVTTTPPPT